LRELGELAGGMQHPAATMAVRRFTKWLKTDATLGRKVERLRAKLLERFYPASTLSRRSAIATSTQQAITYSKKRRARIVE
jgi:hypothetical protein